MWVVSPAAVEEGSSWEEEEPVEGFEEVAGEVGLGESEALITRPGRSMAWEGWGREETVRGPVRVDVPEGARRRGESDAEIALTKSVGEP